MPMDDGRNIGLEIAVDIENDLRVESFCGHSRVLCRGEDGGWKQSGNWGFLRP